MVLLKLIILSTDTANNQLYQTKYERWLFMYKETKKTHELPQHQLKQKNSWFTRGPKLIGKHKKKQI